nr:hypothetical protein [Tanacetum cinerariifolium]
MSSITAQQAKLDLELVPKEKRTKAYKTYLSYATRVTPPKKARKFKKPAAPKLITILVSPKEPTRKLKRVKRPAKMSTNAPTTGVVIRDTIVMCLSKKKEKMTVEKRNGIELLFEVALTKKAHNEEIYKKSLRDFHKTRPSGSGIVTKKAPSAAKIKPSGRDEDDNNNDHNSISKGNDQESESGDNNTQSDKEKGSDFEHETDENETGNGYDKKDKIKSNSDKTRHENEKSSRNQSRSALSKLLSINLKSQRLNKEKQEVNAIAPVLPTKEPEYSLSMGDKHLSTIPETESDEVIKSSVENLIPIPNESKVTFDNESECDVPVNDESSPIFTIFSNPLFDCINDFTSSDDKSLSNEDVLMIYSNSLFDDEEIIPTKIDPHYFNAESNLLGSLLNRDTLIDSSPKFDYLLEEFSGELVHIDPVPPGIKEADIDLEEEIRLVENLLYDNSSPQPPKALNAEIADTILESLSPSPILVEDSDSQIEEINLFLATDDLMSPSIKNDDYDSKGDIHFLKELLSNDPLTFPKNESSNVGHHDDLSFPHPPLKLTDVEVFFDFEPDTGVLTTKVVEDISEYYVPMPNIFPTHPNLDTLCPNIDTLLPFSSENEDKVFKLGILSYLLVSHRDKITSDFSKNPMMMYGEEIPLLDAITDLTDSQFTLRQGNDPGEGLSQKEGIEAEMINIQQGNENLEITFNQVIEDAHVTISTIAKKTKVLVTISSHLSDLSTYKAAASYIEFELKKIFIEIMDECQSYLTATEHRECYDGLIKSYDLAKSFFSTYDKRKTRKDAKPLKYGSSKGTKSQSKSSGKSVHAEEPQFKVANFDMPQDQEENLEPTDPDWNVGKTPQQGPTQSWLMTLAVTADKPSKSFDELMITPIDFSAYIMNDMKITDLTHETLLGPTFKLLKGTRTNYAELEYDVEECYKAISEKLDWDNPEGGDYPFNLTKPLPLVMNENHQIVPVDYFFNNNLKYLQGGTSTMTYTASTTKTKATKYDLLGSEDMNRLTNLLGDDVFDFAIALRMFTRSMVIQKRVKDLQLGVKSYQKKINVTEPKTTRHGIRKRDPYTPYQDPQGFIYVDNQGRNRRWSLLEKKRAHIMIKATDKQLKERRMMRSFEKFVGGRHYGTVSRLLQRTI